MEPKPELELAERLPANAVALYLEMLAAGRRKGRGRVEARALLLEFDLPRQLEFELEVKVEPENGRGKVEIEISWRTDAPARPDDAGQLRISSPGRAGS